MVSHTEKNVSPVLFFFILGKKVIVGIFLFLTNEKEILEILQILFCT